jgi:ATP-dependent DNA ligase
VHEVKHDGYRLIVRRDGTAVHLLILRGYDWTDRYSANRRCCAQSTRRAKDPTGSADSFGV